MFHIAQTHHAVSQEFQCPALMSVGSLAARQLDQLCFTFAVQAAAFRAFPGKASCERHFQAFLDKSLLDPNHRAATDLQHLSNLPVSVTGFPLMLIAHQQHSRHQVVFGGSTAETHHRFQPAALLFT